tara:strand:- start:87 stop:488 length:402 start_codon:yes stop_codon:yes gene_type:complete
VIKKIEHVGVAVKDLGKSEELFKKLLGKQPYNKEELKTEGISISFFKIGDQKIELLASTSNKSPIKKFVEKRKEGIHHIALHVDSIQKEVERLESLGFEFISTTPKKGADNKMIVFLHPKTTNGVLVELCEEI